MAKPELLEVAAVCEGEGQLLAGRLLVGQFLEDNSSTGECVLLKDMNEDRMSGFQPYRHYVWFAVVCSLAIFLLVWAIEQYGTIGVWVYQFAFVSVYAIVGVTAVHAAVWSVLGDAGLIKQTLASIGLSLIVAMGIIGAFTILIGYPYDDLTMVALVACVLTVPLIVAAPIPYWFLRGECSGMNVLAL